jgi:hypothetical protein
VSVLYRLPCSADPAEFSHPITPLERGYFPSSLFLPKGCKSNILLPRHNWTTHSLAFSSTYTTFSSTYTTFSSTYTKNSMWGRPQCARVKTLQTTKHILQDCRNPWSPREMRFGWSNNSPREAVRVCGGAVEDNHLHLWRSCRGQPPSWLELHFKCNQVIDKKKKKTYKFLKQHWIAATLFS